MEYAIQVMNLVKYYGANKAIDDVSFTVEKGEVFAMLGVNGAGKTTILECIEGLRRYAYGRIKVNGTLGVQLQSSSLPRNIKIKEALNYYSIWNHSTLDNDYLKQLGITSFWDKQYGELSTGQKRKIHLALAMLGNPDIVILDEPTAGLDIAGKVAIHQEIKDLKSRGKTIILATHDMSEVEELSDSIIILRKGEVAFSGNVSMLIEGNKDKFIVMVKYSKEFENNAVQLYESENIVDTLKEILQKAENERCSILDVRVEKKSVEECFLEKSREVA